MPLPSRSLKPHAYVLNSVLICVVATGCSDGDRQSERALAQNDVPVSADLPDSGPTNETDVARSDASMTPQNIVERPERSIWQGVFSKSQSVRGASTFRKSCLRCHGEDLLGNETVPTLIGDQFLERWQRKRAGNLFSYMKSEMPPEEKLEATDYVDIVAFLLSSNGAPVGEAELPQSFSELMSIRMDARPQTSPSN